MRAIMSDRYTVWTVRIILFGLFIIFLVHFGKYVYSETWPVIRPLFYKSAGTPPHTSQILYSKSPSASVSSKSRLD
jgi:hypothetical protein